MQNSDTNRTARAALLYVGPVVLVVPNALHTQELLVSGRVAPSGKWVNEEVLRDLPAAGQHQNPAVHPVAHKAIHRGALTLLKPRTACTTLYSTAVITNPAPGDLPASRAYVQPYFNTPDTDHLIVANWH